MILAALAVSCPASAQVLVPEPAVARHSHTASFAWAAPEDDGRHWARSDGGAVEVEPATGGPERRIGPVALDHDLRFGTDGSFALRWVDGLAPALLGVTRAPDGQLQPMRPFLNGRTEPLDVPTVAGAPLDALLFPDGVGPARAGAGFAFSPDGRHLLLAAAQPQHLPAACSLPQRSWP